MTHDEIAEAIKADKARVVLAYAFNSTGKTRLCVAYKNATKNEDGSHTGVYYNAFSEDLFVWENDDENDNAGIRLTVRLSRLNGYHSSLTEDNVRDKLNVYNPKFGFALNLYADDPSKGIESISFFIPNQDADVEQQAIKISRGEERIFVWCFFLALFEVEGWADEQSSHFFIDDPVSSLDEHNIFITASTLIGLVEDLHEDRKIIITTHHIGLYSILFDWLLKGEKADKFRKVTKTFILSDKDGDLSLETLSDDVLLYHLRLLQVLRRAHEENDVRSFHFALLRQALENIASFLGVGRVGFVLEKIGYDDPNRIASILNTLSHKNVYTYSSDLVVPDNREIFSDILDKLQDTYNFVLHA